MKTKALTLILLLTILFTKGQTIESIGIKGGISLANQTWQIGTSSSATKYDYKAGLYCVLNAELFKGKYLSLSSDLGFVQKGMQQELEITTVEFPEGTGEYTTVKTTVNYITFSPMLKGFYTINNLTTYALIGPRLDYQVEYNNGYANSGNPDLKKDVWGMTYGLGAEYKIKRIGILVEFLGQPDFTKLKNQDPSGTSVGLEIKGNAYVITSGLRYFLH